MSCNSRKAKVCYTWHPKYGITLRIEELSTSDAVTSVPAYETVETMRAQTAKWVDETKDTEMLAVTRGFENKYMQRTTPRQKKHSKHDGASDKSKIKSKRSMESQSRKPVPVQEDYQK